MSTRFLVPCGPIGLLLLATAGLLGACRPSSAASRTASPSAVVLVTIDTLRADSVSFAKDGPPTTPFLDRMSADGVVFESAYAPSSWTVPSMSSLMTGVAPRSHGAVSGKIVELAKRRGNRSPVHAQPALPESLTTLAESFQAAGFETLGIPTNLHLAGNLGFGQGFEHYFSQATFLTADQVNLLVSTYLRNAFGPDWRTAWKREPVFLWIHYFDPHDPYLVREPWRSRYAPTDAAPQAPPANLVMRDMKARYSEPDDELAREIRALYQAEINYLDEHLRLLDESLGILDDDVLFVLAADHGEEIVDHGGLGHGHSLFEELIHVPLMIRWPEGLPGGARIERPVSLLDVYPTLTDLAGVQPPRELQGRSLAPLLVGADDPQPRELVFELERRQFEATALRRGRWKLVRESRPEPRVTLFDLARDPHERHDLSREEPVVVEELTARLARRLNALPLPPADAGGVPLEDEAILEQLRALGYVGDSPGDGESAALGASATTGRREGEPR